MTHLQNRSSEDDTKAGRVRAMKQITYRKQARLATYFVKKGPAPCSGCGGEQIDNEFFPAKRNTSEDDVTEKIPPKRKSPPFSFNNLCLFAQRWLAM